MGDGQMTAVHNRFSPGPSPRFARRRADANYDFSQGPDHTRATVIIVPQ